MTEAPKPESPITAHNRPLVERVLAETRSVSRYPKVSDQVECLPIQTDGLFNFGYNPAINSKGWMPYRFHRGLPSTKLAVAQLGKDGQVVSNCGLIIAGGIVGEDDPKLFTHHGDDCISWVESIWAETGVPNNCCVKRAKFNNMQVTDIVRDPLPGNDGSSFQKNFVYFSHGDHLYCIYECSPTHRVYRIDGDQPTLFHSPGPTWPYGPIRGGTQPLPFHDGKLLRFFHSRLENELFGVPWRYYIGAYLMDPEPPFAVTRVSRKPILYGSEISDLLRKDRPYHYKPNVVFVSGAVETNGGFLLSIGENDSRCLLCRVTPEQLNF